MDTELTQDNVEKNPIRQLFITKNLVLCNEVQKTFSEMRNSLDDNNLPAVSAAEETIPPRLQDLQNSHFPLFLTSRKLLLMLDGSLPDPFFRRDASGNIVVRNIQYVNKRLRDLDIVLSICVHSQYRKQNTNIQHSNNILLHLSCTKGLSFIIFYKYAF